jgi:hypothetical protein
VLPSKPAEGNGLPLRDQRCRRPGLAQSANSGRRPVPDGPRRTRRDDKDVIDPSAPCYHVPGVEYVVRDVKGKQTGQKALAIGEVEGVHCAELSLVFDGATRMAQIGGRMVPALAKARRLEALDLLARRPALVLEERYRDVRFTSARRSWAGVQHTRA